MKLIKLSDQNGPVIINADAFLYADVDDHGEVCVHILCMNTHMCLGVKESMRELSNILDQLED